MTQALKGGLFSMYGLDTRSLSLFRWVVGLNVIFNILKYRLFWVEEFYTDNQWLDDKYVRDNYGDLFSIINYLPAAGVTLFFILTFALAVLYCLGIKLKWVAPALFFFFANVITANIFLVHGVEFTIEVCLFWSIFLPIGQHFKPFSQENNAPTEVRSLAVWATLIQIAIIYFTSVLTKNGDFWQEGIAVLSTTDDRTHAVGLASFLAEHPTLCTYLTYGTLVLEGLIVLLIFLPVKNQLMRFLAACLIPILHFGLATALDVGQFYFSNLSYAVILLPAFFWQSKFLAFDNTNSKEIKGENIISTKESYSKILKYAVNAFIILVLLLVFQKNLKKWSQNSFISTAIEQIAPLKSIAALELNRPGIFAGIWDQPWWLFAPNPHKDMGCILIVGQTGPQEFTELLSNQPFIYQRENDGTVSFKNPPFNQFTGPRFVFSWYARKYHERLPRSVFQKWLQYELIEWRKDNPNKRLGAVRMFYLTNKTALVNNELKREKKLLLLAQSK